jgi:transcriptional regulator with XRE-family HTH domain
MLMTASQCRMARAALGLTLRELAAVAGISVNTLSRIESQGNVTSRTLAKVQEILSGKGAVFRRDGSVGVTA